MDKGGLGYQDDGRSYPAHGQGHMSAPQYNPQRSYASSTTSATPASLRTTQTAFLTSSASTSTYPPIATSTVASTAKFPNTSVSGSSTFPTTAAFAPRLPALSGSSHDTSLPYGVAPTSQANPGTARTYYGSDVPVTHQYQRQKNLDLSASDARQQPQNLVASGSNPHVTILQLSPPSSSISNTKPIHPMPSSRMNFPSTSMNPAISSGSGSSTASFAQQYRQQPSAPIPTRSLSSKSLPVTQPSMTSQSQSQPQPQPQSQPQPQPQSSRSFQPSSSQSYEEEYYHYSDSSSAYNGDDDVDEFGQEDEDEDLPRGGKGKGVSRGKGKAKAGAGAGPGMGVMDIQGQRGTAKKRKASAGRIGGARAPGACDACKASKVKCLFDDPSTVNEGRIASEQMTLSLSLAPSSSTMKTEVDSDGVIPGDEDENSAKTNGKSKHAVVARQTSTSKATRFTARNSSTSTPADAGSGRTNEQNQDVSDSTGPTSTLTSPTSPTGTLSTTQTSPTTTAPSTLLNSNSNLKLSYDPDLSSSSLGVPPKPESQSQPLSASSPSTGTITGLSINPQEKRRCRRCIIQNIPCIVSGRKAKPPPPRHEELVQRVEQKDEELLGILLKILGGNSWGLGGKDVGGAVGGAGSVFGSGSSGVGSMQSQTQYQFGQQQQQQQQQQDGPYAEQPFTFSVSPDGTVMPSQSSSHQVPTYSHTHIPHEYLPQPHTALGPQQQSQSQLVPTSMPTTSHAHAHQPPHPPPSLPPASKILPPLVVWKKGTPKADVDRLVKEWLKKASGVVTEILGSNSGAMNVRMADEAAAAGRGHDFSHQMSDEEDGYGAHNAVSAPAPRRQLPFGDPENDDGSEVDEPKVPAILTRKIVSWREVEELFDIFFDKMNMFFSICDPVLHTPSYVLEHSSFLFVTICALASRHHIRSASPPASQSPSASVRPSLYETLLEEARRAAGEALNGPKTIETCQAYLLLGVWMPPSTSKRFAEDRAFLFFGLAIRMATELELHSPRNTHAPPPDATEAEARLLLNRARVWLNCFCNDRSISTQVGKPTAIVIHGHTIPFDLKTWWKSSKWNLEYDFHTCMYANLLGVMSEFHDYVAYSQTGKKKKLDLSMIQNFANRLTAVANEWQQIVIENPTPNRSDKMTWRDNLMPFLASYAKLVVLSIGLRDGMRQGLKHDNPFAEQCIIAASEVLTQTIDKLGKFRYMRYCVEAYFVFMGFAAAFLLKILRPKFAFMMRPGREEEILHLVQRLITLLGSDQVAINNRHTPKLYARFLAGVVADHKRRQHAQLEKMQREQQQQHPLREELERQEMEQLPPQDLPMTVDGLLPQTQFTPLDMQQQQQQLLQQTYPQVLYDPGSYMDIDSNENMPLSMVPLADPMFWEHGSMPGYGEFWDMGVDPNYDNNNMVGQNFVPGMYNGGGGGMAGTGEYAQYQY